MHPFEIYLKILDILYELYQNGIVYLDNHANNFMINPKDNNKINIIDFDITYVKFDDHPAELRRLFENYRTMIDNLNKILGIYGIIGRFEQAPNFIDTYQELNYLSKTLKRIK